MRKGGVEGNLGVQEIERAKVRRGGCNGRVEDGGHARGQSRNERSSSSGTENKDTKLGGSEKRKAVGGVVGDEIGREVGGEVGLFRGRKVQKIFFGGEGGLGVRFFGGAELQHFGNSRRGTGGRGSGDRGEEGLGELEPKL